MDRVFFVIVFFVSSYRYTYSAVVKESSNFCSLSEFRCKDGSCISFNKICDGTRDCFDNSDENFCTVNPLSNLIDEEIFERNKRQAVPSCRKNQFRCRDGTCISFDGRCDGAVDCSDGSDETYPLCRKTRCQTNWFRCTYGACVDGTAPCNNIKECADNSDELQPKCFNQTNPVPGQFKCSDGGIISTSSKCDGILDCSDGSDETINVCAANQCPSHLFKCAYGACVDRDSDCNGKIDCADGSDESDELCNRMGSAVPTSKPVPPISTNGKCVLPSYPEHGSYKVTGIPNANPGDAYDNVFLNINCVTGYGIVGGNNVYCYQGTWVDEMPKCVRFCKLNDNPSVEYRCEIPDSDGTRICQNYEPSNTIVLPKCKTPIYYSPTVLPSMKCIDGSWDYVATCVPECGKVTSTGSQLVIGGRLAERGELPWHVGIYKKNVTPYMQICGGSIITSYIVLSAAHCFWNTIEKLTPPSRYAVAAGKLYRPWNNERDADAQKSDVTDIKIPVKFHGEESNFQDDIALVFLTTQLVYKTYVGPICVDFGINFSNKQLVSGSVGKVAGWGLTEENGKASPILKVVDFPYIDAVQCYADSPPDFRGYITSDKMCAGYKNGTALCKGDSGGGLAFPETERGVERYYLRGIVSTAPRNDNSCNAYALTTFTEIIKHEHFIRQYYVSSPN